MFPRLSTLLLVALLLPLQVNAQFGRVTLNTNAITTDAAALGRSQGGDLAKLLRPVERPIDPSRYMLGPNDQMMITIPMFGDGIYPLLVSWDNNVILPRGFSVDVAGMTLSRFQATVDSLYRSRQGMYERIVVSLLAPRTIYVSVMGEVANPGSYILSAADRVTTAIAMANFTQSDASLLAKLKAGGEGRENAANPVAHDLGNLFTGKLPVRFVALQHASGNSETVDLLRYRAFNDGAQDPMLCEGDVVIVNAPDPAAPTVAIVGAVNMPMCIPFRDGDNALMLLHLAAGICINADCHNAYISRGGDEGPTSLALDLEDTASLGRQKLLAGDRIVVPAKDPRHKNTIGVVAVTGEVGRPSVYPIVPGVTKLTEVVQQAGGLTSDASASGGYLLRAQTSAGSTSPRPKDPLVSMSTSTLALRDTLRFRYDIEAQQNRVAVDFEKILKDSLTKEDVELRDGDVIVIPRNPGGVFVRGRVAKPGWVPYQPEANYDQYIASAGGYTSAANRGKISVVKYGSGVWEDASRTRINAGDEIYVPGEQEMPERTSLETANTIVGITGAVVSITLAILYFVRQSN